MDEKTKGHGRLYNKDKAITKQSLGIRQIWLKPWTLVIILGWRLGQLPCPWLLKHIQQLTCTKSNTYNISGSMEGAVCEERNLASEVCGAVGDVKIIMIDRSINSVIGFQ